MDTHLTHSSGHSVRYMAFLITCSPTNFDMEEVTCLIKVVGEILSFLRFPDSLNNRLSLNFIIRVCQ